MRPDDPYFGFRFRVTLGQIEIAGAAECSGLEIGLKTFDYAEGGVNSHVLKFPDRGELKNLVLKRGLSASFELFDWCQDVQNGVFRHANQRAAANAAPASSSNAERAIGVALVDAAGNALKEWKLRRAFPVKWVGPEFKASDSSVAFESIELAHEGIERVN